MSLEHAILGWLATGPGSGYDLVRQLDSGLGWFWSAPHSQIYPRLRDMENRGLISAHSELVGEKLEKRVYAITDAGRKAIVEWVEEPLAFPPSRDAERLKLIFGDHGDLGVLRRHLEAHVEHFRERRDKMRRLLVAIHSRQHDRIESRINAAPTKAHKELTLQLRVRAYNGDVRRSENEISWAEDILHWLDSFEARWGITDGVLPVE